MERLSNDELISAVRTAAEMNGGRITLRDFQRISRIRGGDIAEWFDGGWRALARAAGVNVAGSSIRATDDELLEDLHYNAFSLGRLPTRSEINLRSAFNYSTHSERFGGKAGIVRRYRAWLKQTFPGHETPAYLDVPTPAADGVILPFRKPTATMNNTRPGGASPSLMCGPPLNFRAMLHEPVNEMGVVALFGMICSDLGFMIESMRSGYPDCSAKRRVVRGRDLWLGTRIEFEYVSSNFRDHGHNPAGCDLIVCWRHDWADCPLEVLELKSAVAAIAGSQ